MRRRRQAAVAGGDRSRRTGTKRRNSRSRCTRRFAQAQNRPQCAQSRQWDRLRGNRLLRNACKRRREKSSETGLLRHHCLTNVSQRSGFLFVDLARQTSRAATWMPRDGPCCRKNFPTKRSRRPEHGSILCTRPRTPCSRCTRLDP